MSTAVAKRLEYEPPQRVRVQLRREPIVLFTRLSTLSSPVYDPSALVCSGLAGETRAITKSAGAITEGADCIVHTSERVVVYCL